MYVKIKKYKFFSKKEIKQLEEKFRANYIGDFDGNSLFYQPFPNLELKHTHYFIVYKVFETTYIQDGDLYKDVVFNAVKSKRTYLISCDKHHFNEKDGVYIDGGRDYTRINVEKIYKMKLENEKFKLI